ncbi:hypothetical protein HHI36_023477 [Cryptolaemus montrouzieri]|uniref:Uncharacterized protein n=1 Tax=Cryptolaemus montrouzieri TaxID=559131 RepID=A0ABD2PH52_9CUCU
MRIYKLNEPNITAKYKEIVDRRLRNLEYIWKRGDIEEMWIAFKEVLHNSAKEVCGTIRSDNTRKQTAWWNKELKEQLEMKKTAWRKYLSLRTLEAHEEYKIQGKKVKKLVIKSKQMSRENFGNRMENARAGNQILFFRMLKKLKRDKKDITIEINDKQGRTLTEENDAHMERIF